MKGAVPEVAIKGNEKKIHAIVYMGFNYLSLLSLTPASGTTLLWYARVYPCISRAEYITKDKSWRFIIPDVKYILLRHKYESYAKVRLGQ